MNWEADAPNNRQRRLTPDSLPGYAREGLLQEVDEAAAAFIEPRALSELFVSMACSGCYILDQPQTDANCGLSAPIWATRARMPNNALKARQPRSMSTTADYNTNAFIVIAMP